MHTQSYLSQGAPTRPDIESFTPEEIANMPLEVFEQMSYKEQLLYKRHWPAAYDRLVAMQEQKRKEKMDAANRHY